MAWLGAHWLDLRIRKLPMVSVALRKGKRLHDSKLPPGNNAAPGSTPVVDSGTPSLPSLTPLQKFGFAGVQLFVMPTMRDPARLLSSRILSCLAIHF
jgi:hypothetical protein